MEKIYAYCRVSTKRQALIRQVKNITKEYPKAIFYKEYYTGTSMNRPEWNRLMSVVKSGSTIVFDSVSRMSRNCNQGFEDYKQLYELGVNLVFLKEPYINTDVFRASAERMINLTVTTGNEAVDAYFKGNIELINKLLFELAEQQIKLAFEQSEKEVLDLHDRISEGLDAAKDRGVKLGLPKGSKVETKKAKRCKEIIRKHSMSFEGTLTDKEVMELCHCCENSYYKYKAEIRNGK